MEKRNFIIAISLGMLLSGDNHIPWGFSHSAAPPFPSLPQSLSCPWGMIFLMIILIVPSWLVIIIKIKYFIHNFPGCSAYDLTPHPPPTPTFLYLHYLINCLGKKERKKKKNSVSGVPFSDRKCKRLLWLYWSGWESSIANKQSSPEKYALKIHTFIDIL